MYSIKIQSYPNREIRFTLTKNRSCPGGGDRLESGEDSVVPAQNPTALDISSKLETPLKSPRRAPSRFGLNAKRTLMRIGGAISEYDADPSHCVFLTGTLPGSTPGAMRAIAMDASWVVHRLKAWIAKRLESKFDFYVWELQRRGALHLHYCCYCPEPAIRSWLLSGFHEQWCRLLDGLGARNGTDCYKKGFGDGRSTLRCKVQAYAQEVRKSVAAYMSKYCSKDAGKFSTRYPDYCPTRWWGCSRPLLALMKSKSFEQVIEVTALSTASTLLYKWVEMLSPLAVQAYQYRHKVGLGTTSVQYFLEASWQLAKATLKTKIAKQSADQLDSQLRDSLYYKALKECTQIMLSIRSSSPRFQLESVKLLATSLSWRVRSSSGLTPIFMKEWSREIRSLSFKSTLNHSARYLTPKTQERLRLLLRSIWKIQDSGLETLKPDMDNCYELSRFLFSQGIQNILSTTDSDNRTVTPKPGPHSSMEKPAPVICQLELKIDGGNSLAGCSDRRAR